MSFQMVVIEGRIGRDPEMREVGSTKVCEFSVAVDRLGANGERVTDWFPVQAWGKTAEFIVKYFKKGSGILISGEMRFDSYTAQDGSKRSIARLNAQRATFPVSGKDAPAEAAQAKKSAPAFEELDDEGGLPF